jgi:hypothetical protein
MTASSIRLTFLGRTGIRGTARMVNTTPYLLLSCTPAGGLAPAGRIAAGMCTGLILD